MDSVGYIVTNKFILIATTTLLELVIDGTTLRIENAKKVMKISDTLTISIVGDPQKVSDLHSYILNISDQQRTFNSVVEDFEFIYNSNSQSLKEKINYIKSLIPKFSDAADILDEKKLYKYLESDPETLEIAKETILTHKLQASGTQVGIFSYDDKFYFGKYFSIGNTFVGQKNETIAKDGIHFGFISAKATTEDLLRLGDENLHLLQPYIINNWEINKTEENNLKNRAKELLEQSLKRLNTFKGNPNTVFYELSEETNYIFEEPKIKLLPITITNKNKAV